MSLLFLPRLLHLPIKHSLFLFGARNTGKSSLIKQMFNPKTSLFIDFLDPETEERFARSPKELQAIVLALPSSITHIILDEIQKIPKLLNVVHSLIESTDIIFIMTGSSARKLKYGGANLLAGRAFVYNLFPFSFIELGETFVLNHALKWGTLPKVIALTTDEEKSRFLQSYAYTYLKEEIWGEHLIKKLDAFRKFLEVAAQCNGKIINYANIARDVGVDEKTVKDYFIILEDTLIGFFLESFQHSFRKRLSLKPKFYFFDLGVARALTRSLSINLQEGTSYYREVFEHFIILECLKLAAYFKPEYRFSYLRTKDDAEIDLVVERPGLPILFIEIKSTLNVTIEGINSFLRLIADFQECEAICLSNDKNPKRIGRVTVFPWQEGIKQFFSD